MEPQERIETLAKSKTSRMQQKLDGEGGPQGAELSLEPGEAEAILESWPAAPKQHAEYIIEKYGPPNEATPTMLIWHDNGQWKRTIISTDEREHNFPTPHTDYISQFIDYPVPIELFSEIARFDGSVVPNRTTGEVFASCDMEAMNFLSLNLMHDIVGGRTTVEEARKRYAEEASAYAMNRPAPYTEKLQFDPPEAQPADPDEAMMAGSMMHQAVEKAKDVLGGGTE